MLEKLSENAGVKIVVHDPSLPPIPDDYGIDLQPNTASSIAVQTVLFSQLILSHARLFYHIALIVWKVTKNHLELIPPIIPLPVEGKTLVTHF